MEGKKFSELTAQQKADMRDAIRGYKVLTFQLTTQMVGEVTQLVPTVFENTIGDVQFSFADDFLTLALTGAFPEGRTFILSDGGQAESLPNFSSDSPNISIGGDVLTIYLPAALSGMQYTVAGPFPTYRYHISYEIRVYPE